MIVVIGQKKQFCHLLRWVPFQLVAGCSQWLNQPSVVTLGIELRVLDQEVVMEIRYYVDNARKMRPSKSFFVTEILRRFEEGGVSLAFPVRVNMNSQVDLDDLGF